MSIMVKYVFNVLFLKGCANPLRTSKSERRKHIYIISTLNLYSPCFIISGVFSLNIFLKKITHSYKERNIFIILLLVK